MSMDISLGLDMQRTFAAFGDGRPPPPPPPDGGGRPLYGVQPPEPPQRPAPPEPLVPKERRRGGFLGSMALIEWLLKYQQTIFEDILEERELTRYLIDSIIVTIVGAAAYGLVVGISVGGWQILYNPVKMPWILLFTLVLCLPSLYVFSAYAGSRLSFVQTSAIAFTATAVVATILVGFAPITWFFMFTAPNAYHFTILFNVVVFAVAGFFGVQFLFRAARGIGRNLVESVPLRQTLGWWVILYALVGAQMAWLLRPFFNQTDVFLRPRRGNFFTAVLNSLADFLTGG